MNRRSFQRSLTVLIVIGAGLVAFGETTNSPATLPPSADLAGSVLRLMGALLFVLALFFGGVWVFRNWQRLVLHKGRPTKLNILEVKHLGQRHALYVVGYEQQRMLVASSPAGISLLSHLPASDRLETAEETPAQPSPFGQMLQNALGRKS